MVLPLPPTLRVRTSPLSALRTWGRRRWLVAAGVGYVWNAITLRWGGAGSAGENVADEGAGEGTAP